MNGNLLSHVNTLDECVQMAREAADSSRRVVLTNGCFDILHRGHLEYLERSSELGDLLIVAINSDESVTELKGPGRPINKENDRAHAIGCLRFVDASFVFKGPRLAEEIRRIKPAIYTKAGDYTLESLESSELEALLAVNAEIIFQPFVQGLSTTSIIESINLGNC